MYWRKFGLVSLLSLPACRELLAAMALLTAGASLLPALYAQEVKPAPATPIDVKKAELGGEPWNPQWDILIEKNIPAEMLSMQVPKDVRRFCPNFYGMNETDKRAFWAYFFQALAGAEAGLDPTTRVRHTEPAVAVTDKVTGKATRSEGLLQLKYEDADRYSCDFDWSKDKELKPDDPAKTILQPKNNLECGIKILNNQLINLHLPLISKKSYWSPLQPGTVPYRNFRKQMTNPPQACGAKVQSKIAKNKTTHSVKQEADQKQVADPRQGGDKQVASERP
jgi:hypothetical protein